MTQNQINYARLLEEQRANKAKEGLTAEEIAESKRTHIVTEGENARHNRATESIQSRDVSNRNLYNWAYLSELSTHNRATEQIQQGELDNQKERLRQEIMVEFLKLDEKQREYDLDWNTQIHEWATEMAYKYDKLTVDTITSIITDMVKILTGNAGSLIGQVLME